MSIEQDLFVSEAYQGQLVELITATEDIPTQIIEEQEDIGSDLKCLRLALYDSRDEMADRMNNWAHGGIKWGAEDKWLLSAALVTQVEIGKVPPEIFRGYTKSFFDFFLDEAQSRGKVPTPQTQSLIDEIRERLDI